MKLFLVPLGGLLSGDGMPIATWPISSAGFLQFAEMRENARCQSAEPAYQEK